MADNVTITENANSTPPADTVVATDEIAGINYQRVKLALGADGAADMDLDSGQQTMANSAPVAIASDQTVVPVDATGQGDVPITLDSEVVEVDATGQGDVPITLDGETVDVGDRAARDLGKVDIAEIDTIGGAAGQAAMVDSLPVVVASDQTAIPISAAALPLPSGAATAANQQAAATAPTIFNVTMVNLDTEYSQALPANTKRFSLQCLTDFDIRFAFVAGKVAGPAAPYALVRAGMNYFEEQLNLAAATLYVASPDAGKVAEIIAWV